MNMQMTSAANPQMKWMMYLMPIMFLGVFNNYSAGLELLLFSQQYFCFGEQYLFKFFVLMKSHSLKRSGKQETSEAQKKSGFQSDWKKCRKNVHQREE